MPISPLRLFLLILAFAFLLTFIQFGVITIAFDKLGLSPRSALLLLASLLFGSMVNLPLFRVKTDQPPVDVVPPELRIWLGIPPPPFRGTTLIAVNLGGAVIPTAFSIFLLVSNPIGLGEAIVAVTVVAMVSYVFSRPIPGVGIGMPVLIAPLTAALIAMLLNPEQSAPLAYIGGTLGVLIGADLLHLSDIRRMATSIASIGGAGTFDGIFLTGIVAALLA